MFIFTTQIRVRYAETDQMGFVYYGNYASYYEVARVEAFRYLGCDYKSLEEDGIIMPVLDMKVKYHQPAQYDDLVTIKLTVAKMPVLKILFQYELYNEKQVLLNTAETTLVFVDAKTKKPMKFPEKVQAFFKPHFE